MQIDGSCHCGEIQYQAEVDPNNVIVCHCTDCQTLSGGAFRTAVPAVEGTFVLLSGIPKRYVKVGESGNEREQAFCVTATRTSTQLLRALFQEWWACGSEVFDSEINSFPKISTGAVRLRNGFRTSLR
jgi:hypothetical protein